MTELRQYQARAVEELRARLGLGLRRLLLVAPTGSGKTVMAGEVISRALARGGRVTFLAHRRELVEQCSARLRGIGVAHGVVMPGHGYGLSDRVLVASIQTLARRTDVPPPTVWIVDEAHHAAADSYRAILARAPSAPVVGLTATPWRTDGRGLGELFEDVVVAARVADLTADGWLVPARGFAFLSPQMARVRVRAGEYAADEMAEASDRPHIVGDVVERWLDRAGGVRTVAFATSVRHSQHIAERFRARGVAAEHLDGEMPTPERAAVLARLASGETRVVSNCAVLTEGWDLPAVECCILARPTLSAGLYLQMVGRVLRPAPGKAFARIHDHAGCVLRHGLPDDDRDYGLQSDDRKSGKRVDPLRRCEECGAIYDPAKSPDRCPECKAEPTKEQRREIEQRKEAEVIDLQAAAQAMKSRQQRERNRADSDEAKRERFSGWLREARQNGYKDGWAWHRFAEWYGVMPRSGNQWRKRVGDPARDHAGSE